MIKNQSVNVATAKELGLLPEEFEQICSILGRTPNFTELSGANTLHIKIQLNK